MMFSFTPEARVAAQLKVAEKQLVSLTKLSKEIRIDPADVLAVEAELRLAHQEADRLRQQNLKLIAELGLYEQQRQNALSALEAYQRQVQGKEQQMLRQHQDLQQQYKEVSTCLRMLQQEHSACAAAKTAGLEAAKERDRLWQDLTSTQDRLQDLQQQLAHAQACASDSPALQQLAAQQQGTTPAQAATAAAAGTKGSWLSRWRLGSRQYDQDTPHMRTAATAPTPPLAPAQASEAAACSHRCGAALGSQTAVTAVAPLPGSAGEGVTAVKQAALSATAAIGASAAASDAPSAGENTAAGTGAGPAAAAAATRHTQNDQPMLDDAAPGTDCSSRPDGQRHSTAALNTRMPAGQSGAEASTATRLRGTDRRNSSGSLTADVGRAAAGRVQKRQHRGGRGSVLLAPAEWLSGLVHKLGSSGAGNVSSAGRRG